MTSTSINNWHESINKVRKWIAWMSLFAPIICTIVFLIHFELYEAGIPTSDANQAGFDLKAIGNIWAAYIPILSAILAYLYSSKPNTKPQAKHQEKEIDDLRNKFTIVLFALVLICPILIYGFIDNISEANTYVHAYQTSVQTIIAGGLSYYFGSRASENTIKA